MMPDRAAFSETYAQARQKFLERAGPRASKIHSFPHELNGAHGEELFLDCALVGPQDAQRLLILASGTHGIEGFAGSAAQCAWLQGPGPAALPEGTAVLLLHAINPWGFSHKTRVNEENVDLNRNFLDHEAPYPENPGYSAVHRLIDMAAWNEQSIDSVFDGLGRLRQAVGEQGYSDAFNGGQYSHPDGFFFGGQRAQWSNLSFRRAIGMFATRARHAALIDLHTGIGPRLGHVFLCFHAPGSAAYERARAWWGERAVNRDGVTHKAVAKYQGLLVDAFVDQMTDAHATAVVVEFGTLPRERMQRAHLAARWLREKEPAGTLLAQSLKDEFCEAFYPSEPDWRHAVLAQSQQIIAQAIEGIASQP